MKEEMDRRQINDKILILGVDALDPRATEHYLQEGKLPNFKKFMDRGAASKDLTMLGGHPTGTPPMWTTLATGCYANVHGITCFCSPSEKGLDYVGYGLDSRKCKAELLWNVFAENGMKTLVFNWPGSSWPPTSDSPNLHVVDGTQPGGVNQGIGIINHDFYIVANKDIEEVTYRRKGEVQGIAPCEMSDLDMDKDENAIGQPDKKTVMLNNDEGTDGFVKLGKFDYSMSPIKKAGNWVDAPEDALEFTLLISEGLVRRVGLIIKNENGVYDTIKIYRNKKETEPIAILPKDVMVHDIIDDAYRGKKKLNGIRSMRVLELADDGSSLKIYCSAIVDIDEDRVFSPTRLYKDIVENVAYPEDAPMLCAQNADDLFKCMLPMWDRYCHWQSDTLHYLIEKEKYNVIFSHNHNVDAQMHVIARNMKNRDYSKYSAADAQKCMEEIYLQTDEYIGSFLHYLDEGWTIFIVSDHALICAEYERPEVGDVMGVNVGLMRQLGFTEVLKDENGNDTHDIDWSKTKAVASRANNIYINVKGKYEHGIVEPEDQYQVEEEIMTALYGAKHPISGQRIIACALRNKDAVIFGMGGSECGDILYWTAEGYNDDHFDALSTTYGINHTSLSPIFMAAGPGIKQGYMTDRIIRQIDVTPTVAVIGGVRMPNHCEGAPVYQILEKQY
ncbi:alkaline phosphatase family protein [Dehalobacter sp. DCM]|uniref:alkaline phosphatase family protein n=1 Tax=Dehalobacter sp. DCM TaxID=2907827 RepID=UPI003081B20B|nr:alkaline phosphatase family protein [Dehalobacter sp. DCM]